MLLSFSPLMLQNSIFLLLPLVASNFPSAEIAKPRTPSSPRLKLTNFLPLRLQRVAWPLTLPVTNF